MRMSVGEEQRGKLSSDDVLITLITDMVAPMLYISESQGDRQSCSPAQQSLEAENVTMLKLEVAVIALRLQREMWLKPQGPSGR
jgi:hypothetical protein